MQLHPYFKLVPIAGALGAATMAYNASINIAKHEGALNDKSYGIGTSDLNFMGAQDAFIAGALFIGFAALARGVSCASEGRNLRGAKWFGLAGAMIMSASLYALTAGFFDCGIAGSKIGAFDNKGESTGFGIVYSVLTLIGAAIVATGYQMSTKKLFTNSSQPKADEDDKRKNEASAAVDL